MATDEENKKIPNVKVVLLGDSGVGKTCIISRYISNTFDANSASTNGASYTSKKISYDDLGKQIVLDIWDTAGQEKYKSLTKFFYKDAQVCILVYDITLKQSFDNLKDYWVAQIKENADKNLILGVAGNKSDLYEEEAVNEKEAREFAASIGAIFALTSALNSSGISELFLNVGHKYLDPNFQQKLEVEKKQQKEDAGKNITLEKNEVTNVKKKKKSGGFC
jgi:small GTP-binding protein